MELERQRYSDDAIDELKGCRSGANTIQPKRDRTGGMFLISTCSGFIVFGKEYIHRETPTEVTTDAVKAFTTTDSCRNYFERLEALGYDNMCSLQRTIHVFGSKDALTPIQSYFWSEFRDRTFVDSFHLAKHICPLCNKSDDKGIHCFDSSLPKFESIFNEYNKFCKSKGKRMKYTKVNDEVKSNIMIYIYMVNIFC